jgi:hypothetical protein
MGDVKAKSRYGGSALLTVRSPQTVAEGGRPHCRNVPAICQRRPSSFAPNPRKTGPHRVCKEIEIAEIVLNSVFLTVSGRFSALESVTLDRTNRYEVRTAKPVRGQVRQKGGSDPLFSPGLRPEKRHGVAPALLHRVMLDVLARVPRA